VLIWLEIYCASLVLLLVVFYLYERTRVGRLAPRVILIMAEIAALFALIPATAYVLFAGLLRTGR
jgi:hypothetical protein